MVSRDEVRSDLERNVADTEARLKNDIRQKQQEALHARDICTYIDSTHIF